MKVKAPLEHRRPMRTHDHFSVLLATAALAVLLAGCGGNSADKALDSNANGYVCTACDGKFYTDRDVFATRCPSCRKRNVEQVLGFVCSHDKEVTIATRGRGAVACQKCGRGTSAIVIPREADLQAWGADKRTAAEVGG
jgi:hypothetical protein